MKVWTGWQGEQQRQPGHAGHGPVPGHPGGGRAGQVPGLHPAWTSCGVKGNSSASRGRGSPVPLSPVTWRSRGPGRCVLAAHGQDDIGHVREQAVAAGVRQVQPLRRRDHGLAAAVGQPCHRDLALTRSTSSAGCGPAASELPLMIVPSPC